MESSADIVAPPLEAKPSEPPGWLWFAAWAIFGGIVSAILVALGLVAVSGLRLLPDTATDGTSRPWEADGVWPLAADLGYGLLFGFALAWTIRVAVRGRRDGWDLRLWPIACAVALATASDPKQPGATALVLIVVVARQIALTPASGVRPRRSATMVIAASTAALLIATFTYQPFHPLLATFPGHRNQLMANDYGFGSSRHSPARALRFQLENAGIGTVMVRSLHVVGPNARLLRMEGLESLPAGHPLDRNSSFGGRVRLSEAACRTDAARDRIPSASVDALVVRVKTLGLVRTQRFEVKPSADLFCGLAAFNH